MAERSLTLKGSSVKSNVRRAREENDPCRKKDK